MGRKLNNIIRLLISITVLAAVAAGAEGSVVGVMAKDGARCEVPEAHQFDFLVGEWEIRNEIRAPDGGWVTTRATLEGHKHLNGCAIIDFWDGIARDGEPLMGITIRGFDTVSGKWSIVWLDDRNPPDFKPLVGEFEDGVGQFFQENEVRGEWVKVRFTWDEITEDSARWTQSFWRDGGVTWETDWIMYFTRQKEACEQSIWT